jgi:GNAT superfamily N-acetyltransferase
MIERDGVIVAYGSYGQSSWAYHPRKYEVFTVVHPDHEQPDIRPFYFDHALVAVAPHDPLALTTIALEGREAYTRFWEGMGFKETMRTPNVELDVTTFDAAPFAYIEDQMRAISIRIVPLSEWRQTAPDWKNILYDLDWELTQDVPSPEPPVRPSFDDWQAMTFNPRLFSAEGWFVALEGDRCVGFSHVWLNPGNPQRLYNSLTGVIRSHRRRGIALALKLRLIDYARRTGVIALVTGNEQNNPIYLLNQKLGFKTLPAWIHYEKVLESSAEN